MRDEPWLEPYVPAGKLAFDVGANVGNFTAHLLEHFEEVWAFEPNPSAAEILSGRFDGRVKVKEAAVGDRNGTLELLTYLETIHTSAKRYDDPEIDEADTRCDPLGSITVDLLTLDSLDASPDFIKIDTEGYEGHVLRGAEQTLRAHKPAVLVEVHYVKFAEWCKRFLDDLGYEVETVPCPPGLRGRGPDNYWLAAT